MNHWDGDNSGFLSLLMKLLAMKNPPLLFQYKKPPPGSIPWRLQHGLCLCFIATAGERGGTAFHWHTINERTKINITTIIESLLVKANKDYFKSPGQCVFWTQLNQSLPSNPTYTV